jgi:hypothetical protein
MIFGKKVTELKMYFYFSEIFLILRRIERDIILKMFIGICVKYPLFLYEFNLT